MGIADHELDSAETAFLLLRRSLRLEGAKKLAPEGLALAVAHLEAEQLAPAIGVHTHAMATTTALEQTCMARLSRPWS